MYRTNRMAGYRTLSDIVIFKTKAKSSAVKGRAFLFDGVITKCAKVAWNKASKPLKNLIVLFVFQSCNRGNEHSAEFNTFALKSLEIWFR